MTVKTATKRDLPNGILVSDLKYPESLPYPDGEMSDADWDARHAEQAKTRVEHTFTFYKTAQFGWCMLTLHISNGSRNQRARGVTTERSYAVPVNNPDSIVRVGLGPHVTDQFTLYLRRDRLDALKFYVELNNKGLAAAGNVRDRISTRRAQGAMHRANGERSWRW
jgi:hypothetical protein